MSGKGWIMLYRSVQDNWVWKEKPFSKGQAWLDLLLLANHENKKFYHEGKLIDGKRGCVYRSILSLAERWGWSRMKVKRFLDVLEGDGMVIQNSTTHGTTISIVNYRDYQDYCATDDTTDEQPTSNRRATVEQRSSTYNNYNNYKQDIGIGYNYTSLADDDGNKQPLGSCITQPTIAEYDEIAQEWNSIPHTISIDGIILGTKREDELRVVISMFGMDGLKGAIQRVKDSVYLQRVGHVRFDNYMNRNTVQKLIEGAYDEDYQAGKEKEPKGKTTQFNSFEQRSYDYSDLEKKLLGG